MARSPTTRRSPDTAPRRGTRGSLTTLRSPATRCRPVTRPRVAITTAPPPAPGRLQRRLGRRGDRLLLAPGLCRHDPGDRRLPAVGGRPPRRGRSGQRHRQEAGRDLARDRRRRDRLVLRVRIRDGGPRRERELLTPQTSPGRGAGPRQRGATLLRGRAPPDL